MNPATLREYIKTLPADTPLHRELEHRLGEGVGYRNAWYSSQKEHWLGWLGEYNGPGAYGRLTAKRRDAQYAYNHGQCAPMLFWLAEALELPAPQLAAAYAAVTDAPRRGASQCGAFRKVIAWPNIEAALASRKLRPIARLRAMIG